MSIKLEVGKYYKTRDMKYTYLITEIILHSFLSYPITAKCVFAKHDKEEIEQDTCFTKTGNLYYSFDSNHDLVSIDTDFKSK